MLIISKIYLTVTSTLVLNQTTGHQSLAKWTYKIHYHVSDRLFLQYLVMASMSTKGTERIQIIPPRKFTTAFPVVVLDRPTRFEL